MTIVPENHMAATVYRVFDILSVCCFSKLLGRKQKIPIAEADFSFGCVCAGEAKAAGENLQNMIKVICPQLKWRAPIFWLNLSEIVPPRKRNTFTL